MNKYILILVLLVLLLSSCALMMPTEQPIQGINIDETNIINSIDSSDTYGIIFL